jgi:hypothetical protein
MSSTQWKPVAPMIVEAARQARARGLSLRAVAAHLATRGMLGPSGGPYLPGSIAAMLKDRPPTVVTVDEAPPLAEVPTVDAAPATVEPEAPTVDSAPLDAASLPAVIEPPIIDAALPAITVNAEPVVEDRDIEIEFDLEPQPAVDVEPVKQPWQPTRDQDGHVELRDLMRRLSDYRELQEAAMAAVGLGLDQIEWLVHRGELRDMVADWLTANT